MSHSENAPDDSLEFAFGALQQIIREWRESGRITTSAGIKPALLERLPHFSESAHGFASFREFVLAAQRENWVQVHITERGHTLIGLVGESTDDLGGSLLKVGPTNERTASDVPFEARDGAESVKIQQLKPDVWSVFIDWRNDLSRMWDRQAKYAFMFPVIGPSPAWDVQPERFAVIEPVTFGQQLTWMHEWAETLPQAERDAIKTSLENSAPKGEFRRELTRLGLATTWRAELQRRVLEHVEHWASEQQVPLSHVEDRRPVPATSTPTGGSGASRRPQTGERGAQSLKSEQPHLDGGTELAKLRVLLHAIIDRMPLAELAALPIRAEYLMFHD